MPPEKERNNPAPENVEQRPDSTVSQRKTNNKQNTEKNSRRPRRELNNTFQPGTDGLLGRLIGLCKGKPVPAIQELYRSLVRRFDGRDVVNQLLADLLVTDYWRLSNGIEQELRLLEPGCDRFYPQGSMPVLTRYVATARRNLDKSLQMMLQLQKETEAAEASEVETEETETEPQAADPSSSKPEAHIANTDSDENRRPDAIDIHDFLSESDSDGSCTNFCDDEVLANSDERVSEKPASPLASDALSEGPGAQSVSTIAVDDASAAGQPAQDTAAQASESQLNNSAPEEPPSMPAMVSSQLAEEPSVAADSKPTEGHPETSGETPEADLPAAA
jgi:hypothetical protein